MPIENLLHEAENALEGLVQDMVQPAANRMDFIVDSVRLPAAVRALTTAGWGYLAAITGLDLGTDAEALEVLYHFCEGAAVVTLRVRLPYETPVVASICSDIPSAVLFEQEVSEMFGVTFLDAPFSGYLFLPEEWPEGVYPLRKEYQPEISQ